MQPDKGVKHVELIYISSWDVIPSLNLMLYTKFDYENFNFILTWSVLSLLLHLGSIPFSSEPTTSLTLPKDKAVSA